MWAELFLWNKQNLISEIDQFDSALQEMRAALVADDRDKLEQMFRLSTQRRAAFDQKAAGINRDGGIAPCPSRKDRNPSW